MNVIFVRLARFGTVLALAVVMLGAWVRLHDAGLGCPDWPGCYGKLVVPDTATAARDPGFAARPLVAAKAWREMIHRYAVLALGITCVALVAVAILNRRDPTQPWRRVFALVGVIVFQALLGMWTVTLLLNPLIVVAHLFGGLATLALLSSLAEWRKAAPPAAATQGVKMLGITAAAVLVLQIFLGGWTSSNYAAVACPDFPTCQTQWWPQIADFKDGFVLWRGLGTDYEGGVLDHPARVAVHFTHRLGALVAALLIAALGLGLIASRATRADGVAVLAALALQLSLGISIVVFHVPLSIAVAHNGVAALLLLAVLNANQRIRQS